jgi:hypothetical protein
MRKKVGTPVAKKKATPQPKKYLLVDDTNYPIFIGTKEEIQKELKSYIDGEDEDTINKYKNYKVCELGVSKSIKITPPKPATVEF